MSTIAQALQQAALLMPDAATARLDADILLSTVLGWPRSRLLAHPDHVLDDAQMLQFQHWVERRQRGEPVAYLTGEQAFWTLNLTVTPDVLIPRPDTELLVECCLALPFEQGQAIDVVDLGTGSGAIALALASERPAWRISASDQSTAALAVAQENARRAGLAGVTFLQGDWCQALPADARYDIIVSNPPYIAEDDPHLQRGALPFEPLGALVAARQGMADLSLISEQARQYLRPGGWLLLEHGYQQAAAVRNSLITQGYEDVASHRDLAGHERVTLGRRQTS